MQPRRFPGPFLLAAALSCFFICPAQAQQVGETTAWRDGVFHTDVRGIVERSDIVLQKPNKAPGAAMPLGNGRLGVAVWAADGFTAQLNRGDTFPHRLSPGQIVVPGLGHITHAADYAARLNLYNGEFQERGGGMTATTYVTEARDAVILSVTGADPKQMQVADLRLWDPRKPRALIRGSIGVLAETWLDNQESGASGRTFGSLAAISADAVGVTATRGGPLSVTVSFHPHPDGSFRVIVACPEWRGGDAAAMASQAIDAARRLSSDEHRAWWRKFWAQTGMIKLSSADQVAEYFENLRAIDLFTAAAESRGPLPGGQAGIGDLFSAFRDHHQWGPSAYWHWNLRMQVSANLGAGDFALNDPYFNLYRSNLDEILAWTMQHMHRPGACVPETMRFNGYGYENETWTPPAINCGEDFHPYYNARTLSTGAEVSLWIWRQYLYTDDAAFLRKNFPVMLESARFLLAYSTRGRDGRLHTFPSNAHETEWDVHDPTTDIAAMRTLFPALLQAAAVLGISDPLLDQARSAIPLIESFPVVSLSAPKVLLDPKAEGNAEGEDTILIPSHDPDAPSHNTENVGLEPVWPYALIGPDGPLSALEKRTFAHRPNKAQNDWSDDPVQAAHLGLAGEFRSTELALTRRYQSYPSGLASFVGPEFYVEQIGVLTDALQSALVEDADDVIRVAPAWPSDWSADATVSIPHRSKVDVQIRSGKLVTLGIETGSLATVRLRSPWPHQPVEVVDARTAGVVVSANSNAVLEIKGRRGAAFLVRPVTPGSAALPYAAVSGAAATAPKSLDERTIGTFR